MNELDLKKETLPDTPEDLAKFVLVGREKLKAVKAEISAIEKVGLANEVHEQKLKEGQEIAEAVLLSEQRLGKLLKEIPKADNGGSNQYVANPSAVSGKQTKTASVTGLGIPERTAQRFQQLSDNPDAVKQAIDRAKENDSIVTRQDALDIIYEDKRAKDGIAK